MHPPKDRVLVVRRIAVVFDGLVPRDLTDEVIAWRLIATAELIAACTGVEIVPAGELQPGDRVAGGRKHYWERVDQRRQELESVAPKPRRALPRGR